MIQKYFVLVPAVVLDFERSCCLALIFTKSFVLYAEVGILMNTNILEVDLKDFMICLMERMVEN
jgi:hypothetical protein